MKPIVIMNPQRADGPVVTALGRLGVATVYEAAGRAGLLGSELRPAWPGARVAGTALTVLCPPRDNLMLHVAVEQARPGDVVVLTTTEPSGEGFAGEVIAAALAARQASGLVTTTGIRDVAAITRAGFPVWSRRVSAAAPSSAAAGSVNVPVSIEDVLVVPGDVIIADDDGVLCVPRLQAAQVAAVARHRARQEDQARHAIAQGEPTLDWYGLRATVRQLGISYVSAAPGS